MMVQITQGPAAQDAVLDQSLNQLGADLSSLPSVIQSESSHQNGLVELWLRLSKNDQATLDRIVQLERRWLNGRTVVLHLSVDRDKPFPGTSRPRPNQVV